jgi:hypothetical protein
MEVSSTNILSEHDLSFEYDHQQNANTIPHQQNVTISPYQQNVSTSSYQQNFHATAPDHSSAAQSGNPAASLMSEHAAGTESTPNTIWTLVHLANLCAGSTSARSLASLDR